MADKTIGFEYAYLSKNEENEEIYVKTKEPLYDILRKAFIKE